MTLPKEALIGFGCERVSAGCGRLGVCVCVGRAWAVVCGRGCG